MAKEKNLKKTVPIALLFCFSIFLSLWAARAAAAADAFPTRPVAIICPFDPGGSTEIELRNLGPYLQKYLKQPVVIRLIPGGGTTIGAAAAAEARPDGYTLFVDVLPTTIMAQHLNNARFHLENFENIYGWSEAPMDVIVRADSPYKSFSDLVAAGKTKPLKAAIAGIGSISHLETLLLEKYAGLNSKVVPYKGGGPAAAALIRGDVDFYSGVSTTSVRFVRAGQVRQLAVLGPAPIEALPDTPTIYQLGYADFPNIPFVRPVAAPPGTPKDRVNILEDAFAKAVADPGFIAIMKKQGRPIRRFTGAEVSKIVQSTLKLTAEYMPIMKKAMR